MMVTLLHRIIADPGSFYASFMILTAMAMVRSPGAVG
jgi:hypothetical protein